MSVHRKRLALGSLAVMAVFLAVGSALPIVAVLLSTPVEVLLQMVLLCVGVLVAVYVLGFGLEELFEI